MTAGRPNGDATNHFPMRDEMDDGAKEGIFTSRTKLDQHYSHPSIHPSSAEVY